MSLNDMVGRCPGCGSTATNTETDLAPAICDECGLVLDEEAWSSTPTGETEVRPSTQTGLEDSGTGNGGQSIIDELQNKASIKDSSDKRLLGTLTRMEAVANSLELTSADRIQAAEFVVKAWEQRFMRGRGKDTTVGASVYAACRDSGNPRPISIVAEAAGISDTELRSTYRTLVKELELHVKTAKPAEYVPFIAGRLDLDDEATTRAISILEELQKAAGNPAGIAAGALYLAANTSASTVTFREAGHAAGLTKETVWQQADKIKEQDN